MRPSTARPFVTRAVLCLALASPFAWALAGCLGSMVRDQARETASRDHGCPVDRVQVASDASVGSAYAYWLDVCGRRRFYSYQQTSTAGLGSGRFMDETTRMSSGGAR